jgi:putative ABC transport system permease protein
LFSRFRTLFGVACRTLLDNKVRTLVALAGILFAIVLIFMQLGFYGAIENSAIGILDHLEFDVVLVSPEYVNIGTTGTFPRSRLMQILGVPRVASACPLYTTRRYWRNVQTRLPCRMLVLGFNLSDRVFVMPEVHHQLRDLQDSDTVLIDRETRPSFGPHQPGLETELEAHRVRVVGEFTMGAGFVAYGTAITSDQNFCRFEQGSSLDAVNLGLVKLRRGTDAEQVATLLRGLLPADVRVLTRGQLESEEKHYWVSQTSSGLIFGMGTVLACVVGAVVLYQVLSSDVTRHLREYATLKAMGYSEKALTLVVVQKALVLTAPACVLALAGALVLYQLAGRAMHLALVMSPGRAVFVFVLSAGMAVASALFALRKLRFADPADLFAP